MSVQSLSIQSGLLVLGLLCQGAGIPNSDRKPGATQYLMVHCIICTQSLIQPLKSKQVGILSVLNQIDNGVIFLNL